MMKLCVDQFGFPIGMRADWGLVVVLSVAEPFLHVVEDAAPECGVFLLVFSLALWACCLPPFVAAKCLFAGCGVAALGA